MGIPVKSKKSKGERRRNQDRRLGMIRQIVSKHKTFSSCTCMRMIEEIEKVLRGEEVFWLTKQ